MNKQQLRDYRDLILEARQVAKQLQAMEATLYGPSSPRLDGMPRSSSAGASAVERAAERHAALLDRYRERQAELSEAVLEIETAINSLPTKERTLCRYYYIQGLTWEQVCVEMNYSWSQVHRIHAKALRLISA